MRIQIELSPRSKPTLDKIYSTDKRIQQQVQQTFNKIGNTLVRKARNQMALSPATGRRYFYKGQLHIASSPFKAPRNLSGALSKGIASDASSDSMRFGHTISYGLFLEKGTKKMYPRPVLKNTLNSKLTYIQNTLDVNIGKIL